MWTGQGSRIPQSIRKQVIDRDTLCQLVYPGCTRTIEEIDHIVNVARLGIDRRDANDLDNLQGVCKRCHRQKTRLESIAGRSAWKRRSEPHPGLKRVAPQHNSEMKSVAPQRNSRLKVVAISRGDGPPAPGGGEHV